MSKNTESSNPFLSIDKVSACSIPYDMPVLDAYGIATGLTITILGLHAESVTKADRRITDKAKQATWMDEKKGNKDAGKPKSEDDEWETIFERAANRVIGWKHNGVDVEYTRELFLGWLRNNPDDGIRILQESADMRHFLTVQLPA